MKCMGIVGKSCIDSFNDVHGSTLMHWPCSSGTFLHRVIREVLAPLQGMFLTHLNWIYVYMSRLGIKASETETEKLCTACVFIILRRLMTSSTYLSDASVKQPHY